MNSKTKLGLFVAGGALIGIVIGISFRADGIFSILRQAVGVTEEVAQADDAKDGEAHENLELAEETWKSMGLKLQRLKTSDYVQTISVPAMIVEKPGHSGRTIPARVHGVVTNVYGVTGQLVTAGTPLFDITLTGDALVVAQTSLLSTIQELDNQRKELARVTKLVKAGSVIGSQRVPLEYEVQRLESLRDLRHQELLVRGLTNTQAEQVIASKKLISKFTVRVPYASSPSDLGVASIEDVFNQLGSIQDLSVERELAEDVAANGVLDPITEASQSYTIESIDVHPGQSISPGVRLAHLAWHDALYIKGFAFERDLRHVTNLKKLNWQVSLEIGETGNQKIVPGFDVHFIDNHVDPGTGAFHFYLDLPNSLLSDFTDKSDRVFRSWTYRPGQRLHVRLPIKEFTKQLVLPISAIVKDGAETYVFRRLKRHHLHAAGEDHSDHAHMDEFQRVTVNVLHRDSQQVVVASNGDLQPGDLVAQNRAYQLYAAQQSQAGQGKAGHSHAGHSH